MLATAPFVVKLLVGAVALALILSGAVLGYIAAIALRRSEGVFLPAGVVAAGCLAGGITLARMLARG